MNPFIFIRTKHPGNNLDGSDFKILTVHRYFFLLKSSFIIFELSSYATNLRKEVAKSKKYYFWDLGIRNALINQFFSLDIRTDIGGLWENFLAVERLKKHEYEKAEIDWLEVNEGKLQPFEFKWKKRKTRTPKMFLKAYGEKTRTISRDNYFSFINS